MKRLALAITLISLSLAGASSGQQPQTPPPARAGGLQTQATAILVDVTVRDRRGQPVTDLSAADFEILEDGVPQEVGSVTLYKAANPVESAPSTPSSGAAPAVGAAPAPKTEAAPPPVIALVFDRLSPEAKSTAHKAALGYVDETERNKTLVGVFGVDLSLITYQNYTRDAERLKKAIAEVGERSTAQFESQAGRARDAAARASGASNAMGALQAGGQAAAGAAQSAGGAAPEAIFAEMQRRTAETFEVLERDQQGHTTSNGLIAVVNSMRTLPGRKSVIFFSEGVAIPPNVAARFRSIIDLANRANVTIYAMDAAGLRTESGTKEAREAIDAAAARVLERNPSSDVTGAAMTQALERNEDLLRHNPHSGLGQLAGETGGVLIRNTNDLAGGFRRIDQDMRNYYMLTYVPKNDRFDGKFRTIAVRVKRSGLEVAARKGYYAVRTAGATPVLSFEAPALALLDTTPVPNAFPMRAGAISFPEPKRPGLTSVVVTVPLSAVTFRPSEDKTTYRADFTVLVRFRDQANEVVGKLSQNYALNGPIERLESARQGNILFYREREVEPGTYTMETAVHDALADKGSVRFSTIEQPRLPEGALRVSQLVLVASAERLAEADRPAGSPFLVGDLLLYPNLGEPVRKSATQEIGFFFTVYPAQGSKAQGAVELMQGGKALAQLPLQLADPDAVGRIQHVSRLPIGALPTGTYDLRVVVKQGQRQVGRSVIVRIVD